MCWNAPRSPVREKSNHRSFRRNSPHERNNRTEHTERQRKYLGRLLAKAHEHGVRYLPTANLTRAQVSAWIDYLKTVVNEEGSTGSPPYLATSPRAQAPDGSRPAYQEVPAAFDHEHMLDMYLTEDDHEIVYCTLCGGEW